ncbi:UDP-N-acetylmuramoyl-tripeptide--D-alanyl-D-alanine ligase [[Haemophilus] ducreyi]|uniref:UDP-N-acetylmuramoyl-tripeptide--D-alanyl-D- alanine ligase n=1 Tax=Haemophilus ducreyi TaxID=730 RepID=UPI0006565CF0|nr:UDP-N-acetylmuramoyl-tripeptide--D-alanyl-D-alanine ligase [[Haemophilus] ducreyi]AKO44875.1 UDP-N-acetylmuramoyl-tripeptide--D-alanyl-D-alanine ligase [[Haemophilus] ducreyi]AKO46280.1 UDP-N-acetylmuramoyl-tripeptide--D-alanyl-D-alanine ligase [[Haemophilus] ducreyi]AKO47623.1 UDP-N-acetylmuramoyl-tripeptide--D-alanyl-D-alanine ligase [[Haemophilus] ducreyi]AKO49005.1 UDP-N-acetylmuramoyl-tripeptide--D-alanyl-D-alanine ligase [[Haemophilus] ducreyi]ANF61809.1 UDP-N-acetylmuramoyl-tripeptid
MIKLTIKQVAQILNGQLIGDEHLVVEAVNTDTRQAVENGLFFALKGNHFDAHHYVDQAIAQGCITLVVEQRMPINAPQIIVADTRLALGELAKWLKAKLNPKTIAITGSSGKTTVKEMAAKILQKVTACADEVLYTSGNLNNDLGVPLTLLRLTEQHKFAVIELGANHLGEIAYTTSITQPDVCVVNNVAAAHLEGFGSLAGVAQAKGEIYRGLPPEGIAIINQASYSSAWQTEIGSRKVQSFALYPSAEHKPVDFSAENVHLHLNGSIFTLHSPQGEIEINLPYLGEHNVNNALAASALVMAVGADLAAIKAGLEQPVAVKGRLCPLPINRYCLLIDDTYNANVDSMKSAVQVLKNYQAFRIFAVADMGELGKDSVACHQEVADFVRKAELDLVVSFGKESAVISNQSTHHFTDKQAMHNFLMPIIMQKIAEKQPLVLLAKGSRSQKMETLISSLCSSLHFSFKDK